MSSFRDLGLSDDLLRGIEELGFTEPTPVQELVIPTALTTDGDFVALAQTGTGKTAAFGLPLLQLILPGANGVQAMILCPTRELCVQVASDLVNYSKFAHQYKVVAVYGGASIETQIRSIKAGAQIVVATPGRLVDLINRKAIRLEGVQRVVLDEADEMLNMGFKDSLDIILSAVVNKQSIWLFSATMSNEVRTIAKNYMSTAVEISTGKRNQTNENIEHQYYLCRPDDRYSALKRIVDSNPGIYGLIFCRTKADCKEIAEQMVRDGYNSDALHGDLSQADRDKAMNRFREKNLQLLIATDVAARGIDVPEISHVINFGLPDDSEVYTHRSGRTGRAGKKGTSISIITPKYEVKVRDIERYTKATITRMTIPTGVEVCERQLFHIIKNIHETEVNDKEIEPYLEKIMEELKDLSKEDLIKRFASVEFNRFLAYYRNAMDINVGVGRARSPRPDGMSASFGSEPGFTRYFVSVGEMDGVDKRDFIKLLTGRMDVPVSAIGKIDIKKAFMHFDIESSHANNVKRELQALTINGRNLRVDDASNKPEGGGGGGGFKKDFKKFDKKWEGGSGGKSKFGGDKKFSGGGDRKKTYKY
jgi:ATP-dependent RNA helicase DeaD